MLPKILVADDSWTIRLTCKRILTDLGYDVITACDGHQAIKRVEENPALIILDVNIPGVDGHGVYEKLHAPDSSHNHLPIIFLTAKESPEEALPGRKHGGIVHKPIAKTTLISAVENQLSTTAPRPRTKPRNQQPTHR
ncbi:MAG: response regulator [Mariniblastus sp.]|nr:response regulator [Mariniblastus sp.]